jgi:hypothetical protein
MANELIKTGNMAAPVATRVLTPAQYGDLAEAPSCRLPIKADANDAKRLLLSFLVRLLQEPIGRGHMRAE